MLLRQTKEKKTEIKERNKEAKKKWLLKQPEEKKMVNRLKTFGNVEMLYSLTSLLDISSFLKLEIRKI